jgi:hypothetical protein
MERGAAIESRRPLAWSSAVAHEGSNGYERVSGGLGHGSGR